MNGCLCPVCWYFTGGALNGLEGGSFSCSSSLDNHEHVEQSGIRVLILQTRKLRPTKEIGHLRLPGGDSQAEFGTKPGGKA